MTALAALLVLACPPVIPTVEEVFPADGAAGLPANVVILFETNIRDGSLATIVDLTSEKGGFFSGEAALGDGGIHVFDPGADLEAGAWSATITVDDGEATPVSRTASFTVGAPADTTPPEGASFPPALDVGDYVDPPQIDDCPDPPGVWAVAAQWDEATDASPVTYAVRGLLRAPSNAVIAGPPDTLFSLEVFAWDAAGNVTAYPPATLDLPSAPVEGDPGVGCGCAIAAPDARSPRAAPFALAALAAATMLLRQPCRD